MRLLSANAARILAIFVAEPTTQRYGYELMRATEIKSGSLYPVLGRFEQLGWISGSLEPSPDGRPPRRVYSFNPDATRAANEALDRYVEAKQVAPTERIQWGLAP